MATAPTFSRRVIDIGVIAALVLAAIAFLLRVEKPPDITLRSSRSGDFAAAYSRGDSVEQPPQQPLDPPSAQFGQRDVNGGAVMQHWVGRVHERTCIAL